MKGQVSLEYLLILAGFFSALAISLPALNYSIDQFSQATDTMLAKDIYQKLSEQVTLFEFLANDSIKTFEFIPINNISISLENKNLTIFTEQKVFTLKINSNQVFTNEFKSKFIIILKKENELTNIYFSQS
jgi:hypothetical protein